MAEPAFIDRHRELALLDRFYKRRGAGLLVVYGHWRIGKTSLLNHWIDKQFTGDKAGQPFYWMATTHSAAYQLRDFTEAVFRHDPRGTAMPEGFSFGSWEDAFGYLADIADLRKDHGPFVAIVDEFTFLVQSDVHNASLRQRVWDRCLSKTSNLRLVLSGSLASIIERRVLSSQAPLYGRASEILKLRPLEFGILAKIFPAWPTAERVATFVVCSGIPAYLDLFSNARNSTDSLKNYALAPNSILFSDASGLFHDRLGETSVYESVLSTIARGEHEWGAIAKRAGLVETDLGHYLQTLQSLEMVRRDDPVLTRGTSRRGRYYVSDPFLRFYYRFIVPNRVALQRGLTGRTIETLIYDLRAFIGAYVFEDLCRDWMLVQAESGRLGWQPEEYGAYWRRAKNESVQLDVVAVSTRAK